MPSDPLAGRLLVATPVIGDPNFHRSVVFLLDHSESGALGVVINRPTDVGLEESLPGWDEMAAAPGVVFVGGPVEQAGAIGLGRIAPGAVIPGAVDPDGEGPWSPVVTALDTVGPLATVDLTRDPSEVHGIEEVRVFVGYAGWGPGQLEAELGEEAWIVSDPRPGRSVVGRPGGPVGAGAAASGRHHGVVGDVSTRPVRELVPRILAADHDPEVRRHLPLLIGGRFSSNLLLRFPAPFLGVIAAGLGTSVGVMGVALSVGEFAGLAAPAVGRAADRRGARTAMSVGLALVTAGALLAAGAPGVVVFALALVVVQLSKVSFDAATTSWIADRVPFGRRSEVTGLVETSWAMALLFGVPSLGLVVDRFGWRWGYVVMATLCGLAALGVWRRIPRGVEPHPGSLHPDALLDEAVGGPVGPVAVAAVADAPAVQSATAWWRLPVRTVLTLGAVALLMGAVQLVVVVEGVWFEDAFGFSTARIGGAVLFIGIAELIGSLGSSRLTDRVGKRRSMVLGCLVMMPSMAALGLVGAHAAMGIAVVSVGTLGFEYALVSAFPLVAELDVAARGTMFTFMLAAGTAMRGVADAVGAMLYDAGGIATVGLTSAAVVAVVLALLVAAVREPEQS